MDTLEMKDIEAAVEGILFASGEPVAVDRICVALNMDRPTVELVLQHLQDYYSYERRGVRLLRIPGSCAPRRSTATRFVRRLRFVSPPSSASRRWRC